MKPTKRQTEAALAKSIVKRLIRAGVVHCVDWELAETIIIRYFFRQRKPKRKAGAK